MTVRDPNGHGTAPYSGIIVGVSPTIRQQFLVDLDPVVYVPARANPPVMGCLIVRARGEASSLSALVRTEVFALDPDLPAFGAMPLGVLMTQSRWGHRVFGGMFTVFSAIALILSVVGVYAVTAHTVTERTREIGVRMALGAGASHVVWLFLRRTMQPVAAGLIVGLVGAAAVGRLLASMLVQTTPTDHVTLTGVGALLAIVTTAASFFPARRAARMDPAAALGDE